VTNFKLEYLWIDGSEPWGIRSKTKIVRKNIHPQKLLLKDVEYWGFDGSSTDQASGKDSDCILKPVNIFVDPNRGSDARTGCYLVLCEVIKSDGKTPHKTNKRARAAREAERCDKFEPWFGLEQEYTFFKSNRPLGFPAAGYPEPQGKYYCGAGADRVFGRAIVEAHLSACIRAGLSIVGVNAEVMPGQWEFQIGGPGINSIEVSDHLWVARYLLLRVAEFHNLTVTFEPKPVHGDWNGAGCHVNFSTGKMRVEGGMETIIDACEKLATKANEHLAVYGDGIDKRLTGEHETCSWREFKWGIADRTASVRIPRNVELAGAGYLEDRRPNANCDPYMVTTRILKTVCS